MIREIRTAEQLADLIQAGAGYIYNDFGGRDPKMCPTHAMGCRWLRTMLKPSTDRHGGAAGWTSSERPVP